MAIGKIIMCRLQTVILETTWTVRTNKKSIVLPLNFSPCQYDKAKVSISVINSKNCHSTSTANAEIFVPTEDDIPGAKFHKPFVTRKVSALC